MLQPGHGIFSDNDECRCKESACQSLKTARIHWHRNGAQHLDIADRKHNELRCLPNALDAGGYAVIGAIVPSPTRFTSAA